MLLIKKITKLNYFKTKFKPYLKQLTENLVMFIELKQQ